MGCCRLLTFRASWLSLSHFSKQTEYDATLLQSTSTAFRPVVSGISLMPGGRLLESSECLFLLSSLFVFQHQVKLALTLAVCSLKQLSYTVLLKLDSRLISLHRLVSPHSSTCHCTFRSISRKIFPSNLWLPSDTWKISSL